MFATSLGRLRLVMHLEAISYLVLLFVAMPLKYVFDVPIVVRIVGAAHGALFVLFLGALIPAAIDRSWSLGRSVQMFVASLVPFANFWADAQLRAEERASEGAPVQPSP